MKAYDVVCLRPQADFLKVGVTPPAQFSIAYIAPDDPDLPVLLKSARALVIPAVGPRIDGSMFADSEVCLVQVTGAGVDRLDEAAMRANGIAVANVAGGSNASLAEYAVACALTLHRRIAWADREIREGNYSAIRSRMIADSLQVIEGATVGVVGLGNIGLAVAEAFKRMGSQLYYFDPAVTEPAAADSLRARALSLAELLEVSDVVTLHVPLLPETRGLIGVRELARMKPHAVLINAARGGVVDEVALAQSLEQGSIGGAAVDVYSEEPPESNPLFSLKGEGAERVLFTPHIAGVTRQAFVHLFEAAWDNVVRVLERGEPALNRLY